MSLREVRPGVAFRHDAAASFERMEAQRGRRLDVNRTTDSEAAQMVKYRAYLAFKNGTGPWAPLALHPKYSNHVWRGSDTDGGGTAWDTDERGSWLDDNGWIQTNEDEVWHREYIRSRDKHRNDAALPAGGSGTNPDIEKEEEEDDEMAKTTGITWKRSRDKQNMFALTNPVSGYWNEWEDAPGEYNNRVAAGFDTGDFVPVTEGHAQGLHASAQAVRAST